MQHTTDAVVTHTVVFTQEEADLLGAYLLASSDAHNGSHGGPVPWDADTRDLVERLANHLNGVD